MSTNLWTQTTNGTTNIIQMQTKYKRSYTKRIDFVPLLSETKIIHILDLHYHLYILSNEYENVVQ